jgi:hypothetical protein
MNRLLRRKSMFSVLASVAAVCLAACGGGGSHSSALPQPGPTSGAAAAPYTGPLAETMFTITIPLPKTGSAAARSPKYVSASTTQLRFTLISATAPGLSTAPQISSFNTTNLGVKAITLGSAQCPGAGPWTCTLPLRLPPGTDNVKISAENASNAVYAQQQQNFTVTAGIQNSLTTVLDANVATMALSTTSGFCAGTFNVVNSGTVATVGTTSVSFNASYKDGANNTIPISTPGRPILKVNGHTDDNGGLGYSDPSNLNVKVTQSTQSFVLQKTDGTGTAPVAVTIAPPNTNSSPSDGLVFTTTPGTTSFTFSSGAAPPANFLAVAERLANGSNATTGGQIALYTLTLGGSDSFAAASPATLPSATNGADLTRHDVDFPNDVLFDPNGDLLIANGGGGDGGGDTGNFSCVPAGSITTGANNATVLTNSNTAANLNNPRFIALLSDSSVALANATAAAVKTNDFILSGTYTYSATRSIPNTGSYTNIGANQVVALPTTAANPAGTYAVAITDGTTQAGNHVVIKRPDGTSVELASDASDVDSNIGYDAQNNQLVLANSNGTSSKITFWDVATLSKVKTIVIDPDTGGNAVGVPSQSGTVVAVSPTGYVAVSVVCCIGNEVNIYNNNPASRALVSAPIPFDATQSNAGGGFGNDYCYGGTNASTRVLSLRWLPTGGGTYNKLLVGVESTTGSPPSVVTSSANGLYIFDISQAPSSTPVAPNTCTGTTYTYGPMTGGAAAVQPYAKQTGFQSLAGPRPLAAAFKP